MCTPSNQYIDWVIPTLHSYKSNLLIEDLNILHLFLTRLLHDTWINQKTAQIFTFSHLFKLSKFFQNLSLVYNIFQLKLEFLNKYFFHLKPIIVIYRIVLYSAFRGYKMKIIRIKPVLLAPYYIQFYTRIQKWNIR